MVVGPFQGESFCSPFPAFPRGRGNGAHRDSCVWVISAAFISFLLAHHEWWALESVEQKISFKMNSLFQQNCATCMQGGER